MTFFIEPIIKTCLEFYRVGLIEILDKRSSVYPSLSIGLIIYYFSAFTDTLPIILN